MICPRGLFRTFASIPSWSSLKAARVVNPRRRINYSPLRIGRNVIATTSQVAAATESASRRFFLRRRFFARRDTGEQHDPGGSLSGSILTEGRLERQFSVSDLG
jgi:hypothetical protein